jgi:hypothetical protein
MDKLVIFTILFSAQAAATPTAAAATAATAIHPTAGETTTTATHAEQSRHAATTIGAYPIYGCGRR